MTKATFQTKLESLDGYLLVPDGVEFSNLNAWGFDGWFGRIFSGGVGEMQFNLEVGEIGTRHTGTYPLFRVRVSGIYKPINPEFFLELVESGLRTTPEIQEACEKWSKKKLARR